MSVVPVTDHMSAIAAMTTGPPAILPAPSVPQLPHPKTNGQIRDPCWLMLEVCREFQRGTCSRTALDCKFAHPGQHVQVENGKVVACFDSLKDRCQRDNCKYLHPPPHLKSQLEINGKYNLFRTKILETLQYNQAVAASGGTSSNNPAALQMAFLQQQMLASVPNTSPYAQLNIQPSSAVPLPWNLAAATAYSNQQQFQQQVQQSLLSPSGGRGGSCGEQYLTTIPSTSLNNPGNTYSNGEESPGVGSNGSSQDSHSPTLLQQQQQQQILLCNNNVKCINDQYSCVNTSGFVAATSSPNVLISTATGLHAAGIPQTTIQQQRPDRLEVCREHQRGTCARSENECRYAHPSVDVVVEPGETSVVVCMDHVKGRCARDKCKYFHPPLHLQAKVKASQQAGLQQQQNLLSASGYCKRVPVGGAVVQQSGSLDQTKLNASAYAAQQAALVHQQQQLYGGYPYVTFVPSTVYNSTQQAFASLQLAAMQQQQQAHQQQLFVASNQQTPAALYSMSATSPPIQPVDLQHLWAQQQQRYAAAVAGVGSW